jgi:hypothetical protein
MMITDQLMRSRGIGLCLQQRLLIGLVIFLGMVFLQGCLYLIVDLEYVIHHILFLQRILAMPLLP